MICTSTAESKQRDCINLAEQFGKRYRVTFDPAYNPAHRSKDSLDPWMMQIPCRFGVIYPHGGEMLAIEVDGHRVTRKRLVALPFTHSHIQGDDDGTPARVPIGPCGLAARARALEGMRRRPATGGNRE